MAHRNKVKDTEPHFIIDPVSRTISTNSTDTERLAQFDHNSERYTFELPRYIDGHDMSECTAVRIHYCNISSSSIMFATPPRSLGLYTVADLAVSRDDENIVTFSWLVSSGATKYCGTLQFSIQFLCVSEDMIEYSWSTSPYKNIAVIESLNHIEGLALEDDTDALTLCERVRESIKSADAANARLSSVINELTKNPNYASLAEVLDMRIGYDGTVHLTAGDAVRAVGSEVSALRLDLKDYVDGVAVNGLLYENNQLYLTYNGVVVSDAVEIIGGGGSGPGVGSATFVVTLTNLLDERVITVPEGESVVLKFNYSSVDDEGIDDGAGIGQVLVGGIVRRTFSAVQGANEIDVTDYLSAGTNSVSIRVTNSENVGKLLPYTITLASVYLTSSFDASTVRTGAFTFPYTPTGLADKTMHFELDGAEIGTASVSTSGRQVTYTIPAQSHGSHILRAWFTCTINGATVSSNILYFSFISVADGDKTPIIAVTTPPLSGVEQYSNAVTKYRVYDPNSLTSAITLEVDGEEIASLTVDRTEQTWTFRPEVIGEITQTIRCGDVYVSWTQNVSESSIKVEAETDSLALYLTSYGRSNNEENPGVWESEGIKCKFENFNFVSDGWVQDNEDITVMRVTGDARLTIPYKMFAYDFRTTGKTLEFELATREVLDYDAEVLSCFSGGRGFKITAQQLLMASEQSSLGTRYKEDEHIRVSIVAEKKSENRLLLCYINGIMSGAVQYPEDDDFSQGTSVGITVGSNDCTTDIYNIRVYDNSLSRHQILDNWIADTQNTDEKLARYARNDVYDAYGQVVISKLPTDLPYMVIRATELPQFKGDKKTCSGYFTDPTNSERSFSFTGAQIDVQGTSSQYYYRKNYKLKFKGGFSLFDGSLADKYQMNDDAVPTSTFTMKADVASSEGAFNVVLSMLYNDLCPYKTPAQEADSKVRQCIEGFPIVIFWDNGTETKFLGKYNFNNDKGTEEVFGFKTGDESWEIRQNGTDRVGWHSADFSGTAWKDDFEARYPEDNVNTTKLKALAEWLMSTDTDQATNATIQAVTYDGVEYTTDSREYRLAKFKAELENHFIKDAVIFYYLFTEMFLSIDQREKNAFPTYLKDEDKWIVLFYDADSSCGTDNKGNLSFDYYLEDIDYTQGGDPIYNGQNSVLWKNIRATMFDDIAEMYHQMRSSSAISYEKVIDKFTTHQSKWPEAIFNEDMHTKCIEPLILSGDGTYLPMLQGKKEQWMKWWLYNRFRYLDSKYVTGTSMTNRILIRPKSKANVTLSSYVNMYGRVYYNAEVAEHRMERGKEYEFVWTASGGEDAVIGINDADMLTSLGDLSPLMVEQINVAPATHITSLKVGDGTAGYVNYALGTIPEPLTLGNNILLRSLDVRNCPNLVQSIDISGCINIEEVYFDGSSITGLKLPNGGILKKLHLPATVANLTLLNQTSLTEFVMPSYANVTTLRLENNSSVIDPLAILNEIAANSRVRIIGFDRTMTNSELSAFLNKLDTMRGLDENGNNTDTAQVSGRIYVEEISLTTLSRVKDYVGLNVEYGTAILNSTRLVERTLSGEYVNDRVTSIGSYAFAYCMDLTSLVFKEATKLGSYIIYDDTSTRKKVRFEKLLNQFGWGGYELYKRADQTKLDGAILDFCDYVDFGWRNMTNPEAIILRYTDRVCPMGHNSAINATTNFKGYIYVPRTLADGTDGITTYEAATNWSAYAGKFRYIEDYTVDGTLDGEIDLTKI